MSIRYYTCHVEIIRSTTGKSGMYLPDTLDVRKLPWVKTTFKN